MVAMLAHALQSCRSARPVLLIVLSIVGAGALGSMARTVSRAASAASAVSTSSSPRMSSMSPPLKTLWSFYLLAILTLGVGRTIEKMLRESGGFGSRYGPAIGVIAFAIGVAGHVWGRRIGHQLIWRAVFALSLLASPGLLFLEVTLLMGDGAPIRIHAIILTGVLLLVPGQIALYRYGFRRPDLWRRIAPTSPGRR